MPMLCSMLQCWAQPDGMALELCVGGQEPLVGPSTVNVPPVHVDPRVTHE